MYKVRYHGSTTTPTMDVDITDDALSRLEEGLWVTRQGEIAEGNHGVVYPVWTKGERSDVRAIQKATVIPFEHIAETDVIVQSESYSFGDKLTVASGTQNKGLLTPAGSGDVEVAAVSRTKNQLGKDRAIEIEVPA